MAVVLSSFFIIAGTAFILIACIGVIRMPDLMMRMHAATKAGVLGTGLLAIALMILYPEIGVWTRAIALILFAILTAPVAAHMIGRAAYFSGVPMWDKTFVDHLAERREEIREEVRHHIEDREEREQTTGHV